MTAKKKKVVSKTPQIARTLKIWLDGSGYKGQNIKAEVATNGKPITCGQILKWASSQPNGLKNANSSEVLVVPADAKVSVNGDERDSKFPLSEGDIVFFSRDIVLG